MFLLIEDIDFRSGTLSLEITDYSEECDTAFRTFAAKCNTIKYNKLHIRYPEFLSNSGISRLKALAGDFDVTLSSAKKSRKRSPKSSLSTILKLRSAASKSEESRRLSFVEYTLRGFASRHLLGHLKDFVLLAAHSIPLKKRVVSRLRLGIYELAANSIEHGTFLDAVPQIETCIGVTPDMVEVVYKDNAVIFQTSNHERVDIENQISAGRKRGLGLSMIEELSTHLRFERMGNWNCTTFTLDRHDGAQPQDLRRKAMEDFSIDLIPFDAKDTLIIRPKGSVDSVSAPLLESQFNEAIKNGQYRIVVDLSQTDFVSSAGLGLILGTVSTLRQNGGDLILMSIPQDLQDTFELMSVDDYFETIHSLDELNVPKA